MNQQFSVVGKLSLDGSGFAGGLNRAESMARGFASRLAGIFAIGGLEEIVRRNVNLMDELTDKSKAAGVAAEYFQELRFAAKLAGAELEDVEGFLRRLNQVRFEMVAKGKVTAKQQSALAAFGLTPESFAMMSNQDVTSAIGRTMKGKNPGDFTGALRALGGDAGVALGLAFSEGLDEAREKARSAGAVVGDEDRLKLKAAKEEFELLSMILSAKLAPAIVAVFEAVVNGVRGWEGLLTYVATRLGITSPKKGLEDFAKYKALSTSIPPIAIAEVLREWLNPDNKNAAEAATAAVADKDAAFWKTIQDFMYRSSLPMEQTPPSPFAEKVGKTTTGKIKPLMDDSMVKVGNFLGTGSGILQRLAERQVFLLARIEEHTRKTSNNSDNTSDGVEDN